MWWFYNNKKSRYHFFAANIAEGRVKTVHESLVFVKNMRPIEILDLELWTKKDKLYLSPLIPMEFMD